MTKKKASGIIGLAMLCMCCAPPTRQQASPQIPLAKELCKTPGLSIKRVEEADDRGVAWGRPDRPFLEAESVDLKYLLEVAFQLQRSRFDLRTPLPEGYYDVVLPEDADAHQADPFPRKQLSQALREAFGLSLRLDTANLEVLVLTVPGAKPPSGLTPVPDDVSHSEGTLPPGYRVTGGTIESLRDRMERAINLPVINETGLKGKFNYSMTTSFDKPATKDTVIQVVKNLGFEVTPTHRQIQILVVDRINNTENPINR